MGSPCWGAPQQGLNATAQSEFPDLTVQYLIVLPMGYAADIDFLLLGRLGAMTSCLFDDLPVQVVAGREGGGRPRLRTAERGQVEMRAIRLEDLVPADHRVRLVWRFVEGLDLSALMAQIKAVKGRPGHPPADPRILMALWLFAITEGIGGARALARRCVEDIPFQWLFGGVSMNHKTLSGFRVAHGAILEGVLADSFAALMMAGAAGLERMAQDGVRVRASAGAASFRRHSTLEERRRLAAAEVARLRGELDADPGAASRRETAARQRAAEDRERRIESALAVSAELRAMQAEKARKRDAVVSRKWWKFAGGVISG